MHARSLAKLSARFSDAVRLDVSKLGMRIESPARLLGKSGAEHTADMTIVTPQGKRVLVDIYASEGEISDIEIVRTHIKVLDLVPDFAYIFVVPRASDSARKLAQSYRIRLLEGRNIEEIMLAFKEEYPRLYLGLTVESNRSADWKPLEPRKVTCYKCGYEWDTKSKLMFVTCPSCHYKIDSQKFMVTRLSQSTDQRLGTI